MKEISIEEKARAYDEVMGRAKKELDACGSQDCDAARQIFRFFPELKESEDERTRKALITFFQKFPYDSISDAGTNVNEAIAWLEKQVKPTNQKFKVGDWIIFDENHNSVYQVERIDNYRYYLRHYLGGTLSVHFNNELIRLWTIQDAKKGDILEFVDHGRLVVGIVSFVNERTGKVDVYCMLEDNNFKVGIYYALDTINPHPATKEQRDTLMKAMTDAGYTFDFEKKELKIEQNPAWSEEDEEMYKKVETAIDSYYAPFSRDAEEMSKWLKSLKVRIQPKQEWNKEDDKIQNDLMWIIEAYRKNGFNKGHFEIANRAENWLKSLKQRTGG